MTNWFKERREDRKKFKRQLYHLENLFRQNIICHVPPIDMSEHIFLFHFPYSINVLTTSQLMS